jgi:serine/threonine-protein kinase mTOR
MLVNAMEVSGIEGNYRSTCQNVMRVLREKSDSLNAMLEAFVHDPLIGWKLLNPDQAPEVLLLLYIYLFFNEHGCFCTF